MIEQIAADPDLSPVIRTHISESGIGVSIDMSIPANDSVVIDVDKYYDNLRMASKPPTPDNIAVVRSASGIDSFILYVIELKRIHNIGNIDMSHVYQKFVTAFDDLMKARKAGIFLEPSFSILDVRVYFVSNYLLTLEPSMSETDIPMLIVGTALELLMLKPPLEFRGKYYTIEYKIPTPVIRNS